MHAKVIVILTYWIGICFGIPVPNDVVVFQIQNVKPPAKDDCTSAIYPFYILRFKLRLITHTPMPVPPVKGSDMKCGKNKKCVPQNLCSSGVVNEDGATQIDPRMDDEPYCPVKETCCPIEDIVNVEQPISKPDKNLTSPVTSTENDGQCGKRKKCVPQNRCSNGVLNEDGATLIDLRMDDDPSCPAKETCCSIDDIVEQPISRPDNNPGKNYTSPVTSTGMDGQCGKSKKCVPQNLCYNEVLNEDGATLIDLRMDDDSSCPAKETCCPIVDIVVQPKKTPELAPTEKELTSPVTSSANGLPCGNNKMCVLRNLCSNGDANYGSTLIKIFPRMYDDLECQSNETCCYIGNIIVI